MARAAQSFRAIPGEFSPERRSAGTRLASKNGKIVQIFAARLK
jgi:hypothetical protein